MTEPIVFISTHGIKEGKLAAFKENYERGAKELEAEKPGTVAFLAYLDEAESEVSTIHVFPDAAAMDRHMAGVEERSAGAAEYLEFREFEIFGTPSDDTMELMEQAASGGATLTVSPNYVSGYLRLESPPVQTDKSR